MKKKIYLSALFIVYNVVTYAQTNIPTENEVTTTIKNLLVYGVSIIALIVGIAMAGYSGLSYMMIPDNERSAEQTKQIIGRLTKIAVGIAIAMGSSVIIDLIFSYL